MNLKESFRYQNHISELIDAAQNLLSYGQYTRKVTEEHYKSKANPDENDETIEVVMNREIECTANQIIDFLCDLLNEKCSLSAAIEKAKGGCGLNLDAELSNNKNRQTVAALLSSISRTKSSERMKTGYGFKFNAEGNQVKYVYDIKEVTTIDFDRNKTRAIGKTLIDTADKISERIDKIMIDTVVNYTPKYDVNDTFEDSIMKFIDETGDKYYINT